MNKKYLMEIAIMKKLIATIILITIAIICYKEYVRRQSISYKVQEAFKEIIKEINNETNLSAK